jgi:tripartite-type tricarboxylate transporter receptor subunit TctC
MRLLRHLALLLAVIPVGFVGPAAAQTYPDHPITMIVPFPPGGVADLAGRPVAAAMEKLLKQPIVVTNRAGAGGAVGMAAAANAKPDGYTILVALSSISIIPEADKLFDRKPAYTIDQLAPIALLSADPTVLVVRSESPWKSVQEFVDDARKRPDQIAFGSSGVYGTLHMAMAMFASAADIKLRHVPFSGGGPALTALLGNNVQALASGPGPVIAQIKAGTLRPLAVWADKRVPSLPDVPTFIELGYKDVEFYIWAGLFAPKATPEAAVTALRKAAAEAVKDPEFIATMDKLASPISYMDAPEFQKFWDADYARLAAALKKIGKVQ